jgi:hypothetical protein
MRTLGKELDVTVNVRTVQVSSETRRRAAGGALARSARALRLTAGQRRAIVENGTAAKR